MSLVAAYPATSILMAINILVFLVMLHWSPVIPLIKAHQYGSIFTAEFNVNVLYSFGGCDGWSAIVLGQPWRLWNLGLFGEPLLGRWGLAWVYILTGVTGNLLSSAETILTHNYVIAVGASGAIFGIAGILIVLLSNRKLNLPWEELKRLRGQVILFAVINLALGIAPQFSGGISAAGWARLHVNPGSIPHIDNSAHIGGLLSGLLLGVPLLPKMTTGKANYRARQRATFATAALILSLFGYALSKFARG
jgi:rhomboid protease GluP